jgi:ABC-type proline/glycine betaine transport system permease subunit
MLKYYITSLLTLGGAILAWNRSQLGSIILFMGEDFQNLLNSTLMTFSISFISAVFLLIVCVLFSWLIFRNKTWEKVLKILMCISIIPSILALITLDNMFNVFPGSKPWNFSVVVTILAFLNLTFLFVFIRLNRQIQEEFNKPYHAMTAQLANVSVLKSSQWKLLYIIRESFKAIMILTFSATVFLEYRLSGEELYKGIYSYFFHSWADTHVSRKLAVLLFILIFLMVVMTIYSMVWRISGKHFRED